MEITIAWLGVTMADAQPEELEKYLKEEGFTVEFLEEFRDKENCPIILFNLKDNIPEFAIYRIRRGADMKWFDDYVENYKPLIPETIISKYTED